MSAPYMALEKPLDEYTIICRGCLAGSGEMKNIFEWELVDDFVNCTNIKLQKADGISELLCTNCEELLETCKKFRLQCQTADHLLQNAAKAKLNTTISNEQQNIQTNTIFSNLYDKKLIIMITAPDMNSKIYLPCPHCTESYIKQKDLMLHMVKTHNVDSNKFTIELQYYCSFQDCSYFINSKKHFEGRKFLNQHYTKVHSSKSIQCRQCERMFASQPLLNEHLKSCNTLFKCHICNSLYKDHNNLLVHLKRQHPDAHEQYKNQRKMMKRASSTVTEPKKQKLEDKLQDFCCDSPKRSFATQTAEDHIKNDVALPSWYIKPENYETKTDEISTQTVFEDLLSLKSQTSEDESIFFSETVSLSDIQTQTFPVEFGLSRSNKETLTEAQSPDLSMKETQTCFCLYESPKLNYRLFDSVNSSPCSLNLATVETQTQDIRTSVKSDVMLSFNSAETQTSFVENVGKNF